jgi:hypothetical protein
MTGALTAHAYLWRPDGFGVALIRQRRSACPKISRPPAICGKKDTASLPQRKTGI